MIVASQHKNNMWYNPPPHHILTHLEMLTQLSSLGHDICNSVAAGCGLLMDFQLFQKLHLHVLCFLAFTLKVCKH